MSKFLHLSRRTVNNAESGSPSGGPLSKDSLAHSVSSTLEKFSSAVDTGIARCFRAWGGFVSSHPYSVIACTTIFAVVWAVLFLQFFKIEKDSDDLFTPDDAGSFDDKRYVERVYSSQRAHSRIISIRHRNARNGDSCTERLLLRNETIARENVQALYRVYEAIQDVVIEYDHVNYTFRDICVRPSDNAPCLLTSILDLWDYDASVINADDFNPLERINADETLLDQFGVELDVALYLGKNENMDCELEQDRSSNVEAFGMTLVYEYERREVHGAEIDPESLKWIEALDDALTDISKTSILDTYLADDAIVGKASDDQIENDIALLTIGYFLIIAYTNVVLFKNSCLSCKMHLSLASVAGIAMAVFTAFGMATTFGVKFNMVVQVLPFLILGLGIDDTFVIVGAYQRVAFDLPVPEKIAQTLERAGSSIFVTSATDFLAFLMGRNTKLPALRHFSTYAALAILFDFAFQVTFFVAFLVIEARREARFRNGSPRLGVKTGCTETEYDESKALSAAPPPQEMHEISPADGEISSKERNTILTARTVKNPAAWKKMCGTGEYDPKTRSFSTKLAGTFIPSITLHPIGRFGVIVAECILLGFAIYGCTKVRMHFSFIDMFTPDDSRVKTGFDLEDEYFFGNQLFFSVYTKEAAEGDYFYHQDELVALKTALENDEFIVPPVRTWYEGFSGWLQNESDYSGQLVNGSAPDVASFNSWLQEYLGGNGSVYRDSVIFSSGSDPHVISSRISAATVDIVEGERSVDLVDSIRNSIETAAPSFDPIAYSNAFLFFDGYRVITRETIRNVILAGVGVFAMNVVVLASVPMALIVVAMVALTDIVLFGYMWYVDQYFNPVTAINLVLAVGIAVDYSAHIAHSFLVIPGDRLSRARGALDHIGGEVISGAFTTWLGIVVMGAAEHYIFQSFFKMFFAIIVAGAWHGLIILPVVLSFVGTKPYATRVVE